MEISNFERSQVLVQAIHISRNIIRKRLSSNMAAMQ